MVERRPQLENLKVRSAGIARVMRELPNAPVEENVRRREAVRHPGLNRMQLEQKAQDARKQFDSNLVRSTNALNDIRLGIVRQIPRVEAADRFYSELARVKSLVEQGLAPESLFESAQREYLRNMRREELTDLVQESSLDLAKREESIHSSVS